jgi:hypothetical protein
VSHEARHAGLKLSGDRKVSPAVRVTKSGQRVLVRNAFGLPAGLSCPGRTRICFTVCYAARIEKVYKGTLAHVLTNFHALQECGTDVERMAALLRGLIDDFRGDLAKYGGEPIFRMHWDGDFFSLPYAQAWAAVVRQNPDITFWAYTRSFRGQVNVVPILAGIPNLTLYLSVDGENARDATAILGEYPSVRAATLTDTAAEGTAMLGALGRQNAPACPENAKRIPLVLAGRGPNGDGIGACAACKLCVKGNRDVRFSISKK